MIDLETISKAVKEAEKWAIGIRQDLHHWPELGNEEVRTTERVKTELEKLGLEIEQMLPTGIVAILHGNGNKTGSRKVIAIRADMDALPIQEEVCLAFQSERKGIMHACGHDVHVAVLLGTARVLSKIKDEFNGSVKLIFQPAEETTGGADRMIKKGCLDHPKVDYILGLHVKPELPAGTIGIKYGKVHASSDMFQIDVKGKSSHGAFPELGTDAIVAASQIISNAQSIVSRDISPLNSAVITFGSVHSGSAMNIISDHAVLKGTIRALDISSRELLKSRLRDVAKFTAKAAGATAAVRYKKGYNALINDNFVVDMIRNAAISETTIEKVVELKEPTMGVEDFAFFLEKVPGAFFFLGSGFRGRENSGIHTGTFEVNEKCIRTGIMMEVISVLKLMD